MASGEDDEWHAKAMDVVATFGTENIAASRLASHIEVKFAMFMEARGIRSATIVIDREVCGRRPFERGRPYTCDNWLRRFLPVGYELTVVEPEGHPEPYRGERRK